MAEQKEAWAELKERLEALGLKLKLHREQAGDTGAKDALETLGRSLKQTFDAASKAINDEAVRADVKASCDPDPASRNVFRQSRHLQRRNSVRGGTAVAGIGDISTLVAQSAATPGSQSGKDPGQGDLEP